MRVSELNEIVTIDKSIQSLLSDLQDLYMKRQSIVEVDTPPKSKSTRRAKSTKATSLSSLDFDDFDLSLGTSLLPKRRNLFG